MSLSVRNDRPAQAPPQPGRAGAPGATSAGQKVKIDPVLAEALGAMRFDGVDAQQASLMNQVLTPSVQNAEAANLGAAHSDPALAQTFSTLAERLVPPRPGATSAKAFSPELAAGTKEARSELGRMESKQVVVTARLVANAPLPGAPLTPAQAQVAQFLKHLGRLSSLAVRSQGSDPEVSAAVKDSGLGAAAAALATDGSDAATAANGAADADPTDIDGASVEDTPIDESVDPTLAPMKQFVAKIGPRPNDIDSVVQQVMFECGMDAENDLRVELQKMEHLNQQKQAQRAVTNAYQSAQADLNATLQDEYRKLQSQEPPRSKLDPSIKFEDYKQWRQVTWSSPPLNADGFPILDKSGKCPLPVAQLLGPSPPFIPKNMALPPSAKDTTPLATRQTANTPEPNSADSFGITEDSLTALRVAFNAVDDKARQTMGWPSFEKFLVQIVGLRPVTNDGDIAANNQALNKFLDPENGPLSAKGEVGKAQAANISKQRTEAQSNYVAAIGDVNFSSQSANINKLRSLPQPNSGGAGDGNVNPGDKFKPLSGDQKNQIKTSATEMIARLRDLKARLTPPSLLTHDQVKKIKDEISKLTEALKPRTVEVYTLHQHTSWWEAWDNECRSKAVAGYSQWWADERKKNPKLDPNPFDAKGQARDIGWYRHFRDAAEKENPERADRNRKEWRVDPSQAYTIDPLEGLDRGEVDNLCKDINGSLDAAETSSSLYGVKSTDVIQSLVPTNFKAPDDRTKPLSTGVAGQASTLRENIKGMLSNPSLNEAQKKELNDLLSSAGSDEPMKNPDKFLQSAASVFQEGLFRDSVKEGGPLHDALIHNPDSDRVNDLLSCRLLGTDPKTQPSETEKLLIGRGLIDDPALVATERRRQLKVQITTDQLDAEGAKADGQWLKEPGVGSIGVIAKFAAEGDGAKSTLDSLGDLAATEQLKLQSAVERRSKFFETLSNILKQMSSSGDAIIANLK